MESLVHLIRHGKVYNPDNIRYGRAPGFHLSDLGRAQAKAAGQFMKTQAPLVALISSPLERAAETAAIIAGEIGFATPVPTDERLLESLNRFDGLHRYAVLQPWRWPKLWNPFAPSWGESFKQIAARMRSVIEERRVAGAAIALVSHQAPIWIARQSYEAPGRVPWLARRGVRCTQASVTTLRFEGDRYLGHTYWAPPDDVQPSVT
ncbi:MAG: histidine phosphatase family protein [Deltaproteobacteria bacterium]|nr:histidine phosphatase family protein [Deltaproteobacteria bacterium]